MANELLKIKLLELKHKRDIDELNEAHKRRLREALDTNKVFLDAFKRELDKATTELDKIKCAWWYKLFKNL